MQGEIGRVAAVQPSKSVPAVQQVLERVSCAVGLGECQPCKQSEDVPPVPEELEHANCLV